MKHHDKHGAYELDHVFAITPLIEKNRDGEVKSKKAQLHFHGGSLATDTDYDEMVAAKWPAKSKDE